MLKRNKIKHINTILLSVLVVCSLMFARVKPVNGAYQRESAKDVSNGTVILGRHMIYLQKLTPKLKELAMDSASEDGQTGQDNIYYKSEVISKDELGTEGADSVGRSGTWYRINDISEIYGIVNKGEPVSNGVIDQLDLLYHTKEDGVTYNLLTGKPVDIYNMSDPYDLYSRPELENLKVKYESFKSEDKVAKQRAEEIKSLEAVLKAKIEKSEAMKTYDANLEALQKLNGYMQQQEAQVSELAVLDEIRSSEDANREILILEHIKELVQKQIQFASAPGTKTKEADEEEETIQPYVELNTAYEVAMGKIEESITSYSNKILNDGTAIFAHTKYTKAQSVIASANAGDYTEGYRIIKEIVAVENISSGVVVDKTSELQEIDEMQSNVLMDYENMLKAATTKEYTNAVAQGESQWVLEGLQSDYVAAVTEKRTELETLVNARILRLDDSQTKIAYLEDLMQKLNTAKFNIPKGEFQEGLIVNAGEIINTLAGNIANLQAELNGGTEQEKIRSELDILETEYKERLDKGDLAGAEIFKEKMNAKAAEASTSEQQALKDYAEKQEEIKKLEKQKAGLGNSAEDQAASKKIDKQLADLQVELNALKGSMSDGKLQTLDDLNAKVSEAKEKVKDAKSTSDMSSVKETVNDIIESSDFVGATVTEAALKEISDAIAAKTTGGEPYPSELTDIYNTANAAIESGITRTIEGMKTEEEIELNIENVLDKETNLSDIERQTFKLMTLAEASERTGDSAYLNLYNKELQNALSQGNILVVKKLEQTYNGNKEICIPVDVVAKFIGGQYAWSEDYSVGYLLNAKKVYKFLDKSDVVEVAALSSRGEDITYEKEQMSAPTLFRSVAYVPNTFVEDNFKITVKDLKPSPYAVIYNISKKSVYDKLLNALVGD